MKDQKKSKPMLLCMISLKIQVIFSYLLLIKLNEYILVFFLSFLVVSHIREIIITCVVAILIFVICTTYLCLRYRNLRKEMQYIQSNFENGNLQSLNPDLVLNEQADSLPYDRKFEFPRQRLKLGKQIGSGSFGVVLKGIAYGIRTHEHEKIVAVKMLKRMADNEVRSI